MESRFPKDVSLTQHDGVSQSRHDGIFVISLDFGKAFRFLTFVRNDKMNYNKCKNLNLESNIHFLKLLSFRLR